MVVGTVHEAREPGAWQRVFATREGLTGGPLATGGVIRPGDQFVALPHPSALRRDVEIRYGARAMVVPVLDVGPWNADDPYWSNGQAPGGRAWTRHLSHPRQPGGHRPVGRHLCHAWAARQRFRRVALRPPRLHSVAAADGRRPLKRNCGDRPKAKAKARQGKKKKKKKKEGKARQGQGQGQRRKRCNVNRGQRRLPRFIGNALAPIVRGLI